MTSMNSRILRAACGCVLGATFILPGLPTMACGPEFSPPVLTQESRPDGPPDAYAAGRLGVVLPTYVHSHLVIAYRYLSGKPLSPAEQRQFVALWNRYDAGDQQGQDVGADSSYWNYILRAWAKQANASLPNSPQTGQTDNGMASLSNTYDSYGNCYTN